MIEKPGLRTQPSVAFQVSLLRSCTLSDTLSYQRLFHTHFMIAKHQPRPTFLHQIIKCIDPDPFLSNKRHQFPSNHNMS